MTNTITYEDLKLPVYLNSRIVGALGGTPLTVTDAINAAQLAKLNVFLAGKKGTGKTQLLRDLYRNRYGGNGAYLEGRADLKADEVYKAVNLKKLREGALTSEELIELTQKAKYHFVGVDELNRCPEVTQNELLSVMNGEITYNYKPLKLGDGFSVGVATGNLGNGGYVGTFKIDDALADRLHLFLDLDYWKPTDEDMAALDHRTDLDPRVIDSTVRDISDKIIAVYKEIQEQSVPLEATIVGRYLERALDYCATFPAAGNSKDNLKEAWPVICAQKNCRLKDTLCARMKSVGERTVKNCKRLATGLQYVAHVKNPEAAQDPLGAMLVAAKLVLPYSGSLSPAYLREEGNFNNPNLATKKIIEDIEKDCRTQFGESKKPGPLTLALAYASKGKLAERPYEPSDAKWQFVKPLLAQLNERNKQ
jgi:MoxR-like ATPase